MPAMNTTTITSTNTNSPDKMASAGDPKINHRRVCFSFAAYAKSVISHLRSIGVPIAAGLSDVEFSAVESSLRFEFPPDLRSILREGLPVGAGFPNWRSASPQQLELLLSLPVNGLLNEIATRSLWPDSFGLRPSTTSGCVSTARSLLEKAPILVPIYRNFYIPNSCPPLLNGNPIFFVRGGSVKCSAFDLSEFFRRFRAQGREEVAVPAPAWAAKSARRVEVWSALADEVEMLMEGEDDHDSDSRGADRMVLRDPNSVTWHVRLLALALLRSGWSTEDVVYCMGSSSSSSSTEGDIVTWHVDPISNEISMDFLR